MNPEEYKKRKRIARPPTLVFFGVVFLCLPLVNIGTLLYLFRLWDPIQLFRTLHPLMTLLIFIPLPIGIGLLMVKKWGWRLCLAYSTALIIYNVYAFIDKPILYNLGVIFPAVLFLIVLIYFVRPDISAPYFKLYPRGWRLQKRLPLELQVRINQELVTTTDISSAGFYARRGELELDTGEEVSLELFDLDNNPIQEKVPADLKGGVVRVDPDGVGIAFRYLDEGQKRYLAKLFHQTYFL